MNLRATGAFSSKIYIQETFVKQIFVKNNTRNTPPLERGGGNEPPRENHSTPSG